MITTDDVESVRIHAAWGNTHQQGVQSFGRCVEFAPRPVSDETVSGGPKSERFCCPPAVGPLREWKVAWVTRVTGAWPGSRNGSSKAR